MSLSSRSPAIRTGQRRCNGSSLRTRVRVLASLAILCLFASPCSAADAPGLEDAVRLERGGDAAGAVKAYKAWLAASPGSPLTDDAFAALFRLQTNLPDLLELASLPGLGPQSLVSLARLCELSGRSEEARALYERSWQDGGNPEALVALLLLSLDMNDTQSVFARLDLLRDREAGWAEVIGALADLMEGRTEAARERFSQASRTAEGGRLALAALWGLRECARRTGDSGGLAAAAAEIERRFPLSPEKSLAAGTINPAPSPGLFGAAAPGDLPAAGGQEMPQVEPGRFSVQAGSFKVRENADELSADLAKKGFTPVVREEARQGAPLYKVLAGVGLEREAAVLLAERLSKAGYAGFVISEAR
jgi:cell division septation protein DedD